jgi:hypothetical protein
MEITPTPSLRDTLQERSARLQAVASELKAELFGIDEVIDRVLDSLRAWYLLPALITRPVIVCLWGLTGTGKTELARKVARKLGFYDRFVEVQMDGFSPGSTWRSAGSISAMLGQSGIAEGEPGILLLDEFQRYRTIDTKGDDLKVERYQDVWMLLSDGRLAPALSFLNDLEDTLAYAQYTREEEAEDDGADAPTARKKAPRFRLGPFEARELQRSLKLKEPLLEIMGWDPARLQQEVLAFRGEQQSWETDYSKLLVFVAGNLDEMYVDTARRVEDCDTDADIFHAVTRKLSVIDVKKALSKRFKPEQIARLGNNHVIYPSFSRATYERLIGDACGRYAAEVASRAGVQVTIDPSVRAGIYANGVFPAQGTRPLFSTIHALLSAPLVDAALWALETGAQPATPLVLSLDVQRRQLVARMGPAERHFAAHLELSRLKQRSNRDFRALLAVHEAGHGLVHAVLFGRPPEEIRINVASFEGGYNSYSLLKADSRRDCLDAICVSLAGRAAEALVFGDMACTTGAEHDYKQATATAARYVRHWGFGTRCSRTDVSTDAEDNVNTDVVPTNAEIEALLRDAADRAQQLLRERRRALLDLVAALMERGYLSRAETAALLGLAETGRADVSEPYADLLDAFAAAWGTVPAGPLLPAETPAA